MVIIREAGERDWPLWSALRRTALADAPHAFTARAADWHRGEEDRWRTASATPGSYNMIAERSGEPAGMARIVPTDPVTDIVSYDLRSVWVSPTARGLGVGDRLIAACEERALGAGSRSLRLLVVPGNATAIALYLRRGFVTTDDPGPLLPDGVTRQRVMRKPLTAGPLPRGPLG
ncbi:GNAT family N-acetyltransferase [Streptomyces sp. NPDC058953]|uniref:GNAT family N-acetyltransferase n=1 Tax=unclassified Streptomyces TaxID=2593676 RepID=UPI0036AA8D80